MSEVIKISGPVNGRMERAIMPYAIVHATTPMRMVLWFFKISPLRLAFYSTRVRFEDLS